jgi:5-methylcytosine-specific restriction endonuclease McrA
LLINPLYLDNEELFICEMDKRLRILKNLNDLYFFTEETEKKTKQKIPAIIKKLVWNTYIGEEIGKSKCVCCKKIDITQLNFICGHVLSEYNGGKVNVENLRPICMSCNLSMGTKNMQDFILNYFYE